LPRLVTELGRVREVMPVFEKLYCPILVTEFGNITEVKLMSLLKA
jgi:hypothetical protein